jgi:hypothetical protein
LAATIPTMRSKVAKLRTIRRLCREKRTILATTL